MARFTAVLFAILVAAQSLLAGCDTTLTGIEIGAARPLPRGTSAQLTALAPDPSRPGGAVTLLWVGCDADPYNLGRTACADATLLQDPSALTGGTGTLPPGVSLIGFNDTAAWTAPATAMPRVTTASV